MVFRRTRSNRLGTIVKSFKHIIDVSGSSTDVNTTIPLSTGIDVVADPNNEAPTGSQINGIYISLFVIGASGAPLNGPIDWYLAKSRSGQNVATAFPTPGATGGSNVRNQILHEEKGLSGSGDGTPMVFKGVIAIPKSMRRVREGDFYFILLKSATGDTNSFCCKAIYKHFE